jgi:hypothetical protein
MKNLTALVAFAILIACQQETISTKNEVTINQLAGGAGNSKNWKIASAVLTGPTSPAGLTVSDLTNIKDDEFVFVSNPNSNKQVALTWNVRNEIRTNISSANNGLLDYYLSPIKNTLTVQPTGVIDSVDPNMTLQVISDDKLSLIYIKGPTQLTLELYPQNKKTTEITGSLQFEKLTEITGKGIEQAPGFTGSEASNSLYIAYRRLDVTPQPERIVRYSLNDGVFTTRDFFQPDFVTKEIHIINDELKVIGAQFVNTYSLDLDKPPLSFRHNLILTRFGSTVIDDNIFIFGGSLSDTTKSNIVYKQNQNTGLLSQVGTLPENRYWAHGEIVDDKLYVFGGRIGFNVEVGEDDIFVFDLNTATSKTLKLPNPMYRTFAARFENFIFIAGQRNVSAGKWETNFGVFDTHNDTYTELSSSLASTSNQTVFGITIVGTKLYVLYGNPEGSVFSVYSSALPIRN